MGIKSIENTMLVKEKEQKIVEKIYEITGIRKEIIPKTHHGSVKHFRDYRIKKILLISSSYNYFRLEEEGRLSILFSKWASFEHKEKPPDIVHVETAKEGIDRLKKEDFDIIILFNLSRDTDITKISENIKKISEAPIVLLDNDIHKISKISNKNKKAISKVFTWNGDGKILLSIIQYFEDLVNIQKTSSTEFKKYILLIEDSIQDYSRLLSLINEEIYAYLKSVIDDKLSLEQKLIRFKRRPFVLHVDDFEQSIEFFEKFNNDLICVITDNYIEKNGKRKQIGLEIIDKAKKINPNLPILLQSSEPLEKEKIKNKNVKIISKNSPNLINTVRNFIKKSLAYLLELNIKDNKGKSLKIKTIEGFERALKNLNENVISKYAKQNIFSNWLKNIGEIEFSNKCRDLENKADKLKNLKTQLINLVEDYYYSVDKTSIFSYSRRYTDPFKKITRIGEGSLGGKARGLTFIAKLISKYFSEEMFPELKITVPRSIIISTDVFDTFIEQNHLSDLEFTHLSDHRISAKFMEANLPATILGDLRAFIKNTRKPLIIRSSGLLEDSLIQPFAGIYGSVIFPNESWETDARFQEICNSIKYVYASTYFEKARNYIKNTPKNIGEEKMAVIIQEVIGLKHDNYFYPTISGVAKSYNYYPSADCKPEEGIVYLALGLGKYIVDGAVGYAFCPEKPKTPLFGTPKDYMNKAQTKFYALNLKTIFNFANFNEEIALEKLDIGIAKKHGVLDKIASTYFPQDDQIYPGVYEEGYLVLDFGPIIKYDELPIAKAIKLLLQISEISLGYPVEIEFAINIPKEENKQAELFILQVRSMVPFEKKIDVDINKVSREKMLIYSENALGNGIHKNIKDVVYVDRNSFDLSNSTQVADQIKKINTKLMDQNRSYILIGPGRWGSTDPWLGIPVIWSDIAGVKVIVETPYKDKYIDPSQGSHFFHDMIASQVLYLITKKEGDIKWDWFKKQKIIEETEFIKHIETQKPLKTIVDGKIGRGIILK